MRLKSFHERDNTKLHEDVATGLSKTEQRLRNYFSRIEIMGERLQFCSHQARWLFCHSLAVKEQIVVFVPQMSSCLQYPTR